MNSKKLQRAYTLIEMLTVTAIIMIMVLVLTTLSKPQKRFALQRNIYSFSANARRIQEMSMSIATIKIGGVETVPLGGYGIEISSSASGNANKKYYLYYNADNSELGYQDNENINTGSKSEFADGVYVSSIKGIDINNSPVLDIEKINVIFYPPDPKILIFYGGDPTNELRNVEITLKIADTQFFRRIYINKMGLISVDQTQSVEE